MTDDAHRADIKRRLYNPTGRAMPEDRTCHYGFNCAGEVRKQPGPPLLNEDYSALEARALASMCECNCRTDTLCQACTYAKQLSETTPTRCNNCGVDTRWYGCFCDKLAENKPPHDRTEIASWVDGTWDDWKPGRDIA